MADTTRQQLSSTNEVAAESLQPLDLGRYVASGVFAVDVAENWRSEYLRFTLFILLTMWLVQPAREGGERGCTGVPWAC